MVHWPTALIREIADRRVLLFVGAGLSKAAHPAMPTWPELIKRLSAKLEKVTDRTLVKKLCGQHRLLDAAQIISDGIERADLNATLRENFQIRPSPHHDIYKSILDLDLKTIVTTNYDEFLEKNFDYFSGGEAAYNTCRYTSHDLIDQLRSPQRTIVKMHGCITEPGGLLLDRMSYFRAQQDHNGFFKVLSSLFTINTVLFAGYSLGDPDLQMILENIHAIAGSTHGHYALLPKQEHRSIVKAIRQSYNITCIEYPNDQHAIVPEFISKLSESVHNLRSDRGIV
jgi:hypothetical protein